MLTRGEAASAYNNIIDVLVNKDYFFHTVDGEDLHKGKFSYSTFIEKISKFEYIDTDEESYSKIYVNPLMRVLLILGSTGTDTVEFGKISFELLEFVYEQLHSAVGHGYRLALEDARKGISDLLKGDGAFDF